MLENIIYGYLSESVKTLGSVFFPSFGCWREQSSPWQFAVEMKWVSLVFLDQSMLYKMMPYFHQFGENSKQWDVKKFFLSKYQF